MDSLTAARCRFRISNCFTNVVTVVVKSNIGNLQSAVQIPRPLGKWHSVCACPPDLGSDRPFVTTLEDDFTTFFNDLLIWICSQVQSSVSVARWSIAIILIGTITTIHSQITSAGRWNALTGVTPELSPGASTVSFIRLIAAVCVFVAHQIVRNALSIATGELRCPARAILLI